jgi:hypothetical protein
MAPLLIGITVAYILRVKVVNVVNEPNDVAVELQTHLTDDFGVPFIDPTTSRLDEFTIRAPKSSVPGAGLLAYLTALATTQISLKYDLELVATGIDGSDEVSLLATDVDKVFTDLLVDGPGLSAPATLDSVISTTQILLSSSLTLEYTADTTNQEFSVTGTVTLDDNTITAMSDTSNIEQGMNIFGTGIPAFATVVSVLSASSIVITQNAVVSAGGTTLTFSIDPDSTLLTAVSPAILTDRYEGMVVDGPGVVTGTTVAAVNSGSELVLSEPATADNTTATYTITGSAFYFFDTSGLTIDFTDLQRVIDIIDFTAL